MKIPHMSNEARCYVSTTWICFLFIQILLVVNMKYYTYILYIIVLLTCMVFIMKTMDLEYYEVEK